MRKFTNPKTLKGQDKINRITDLMSRMTTLNESTSLSEIDFIKKGPNGIVYGIIRENHNYFIKTTEKTSGTLIAEDFEYVGGAKNKYIERYNTYTEALKQLNMKFDMLNESYGIEVGSNLFESDGHEIQVSNASGVVVKETKIDGPIEDDADGENPDNEKIVLDEEPEDVEEQKQVIRVKTPKAPVEDTVEVDEFAMDDMETAEGGGEDPFDAEDGGEGIDDEGIDDEGMDDEDGDETTKKIQKLTGKVTQLMRDMDDPDSELDKYVINSVISAIDFEEMDEEDVEDIIAKIEGEDEEAGEGDEFDTEEVDVDLDVEEFPEGEPSEDQITEDSEGEETYNYGEDEGADEKKLKKLKKKKQTKDTKSHETALSKDEDYDEDHEDREEEGTEFNESRSFSKKQLMETFLRKNVKNSLKKVLKENHSMCEECLGEGCESCMGEHHNLSDTNYGEYNRNEYMLEDDDMDMLAGDDVHEDIDYMDTEMLGQDVLYRTGEEPKFDRDGDGISNEYDVDSNDDGSIDYGMGNKMYDWPERTFGRKGDRDSDGIPNTNDDNPGTPSWEDDGDDFIEIDFESLMGNAPVKEPGVAPPTTTPSTTPGKPRWKKIRKPEPGTQGKPKAEVARRKATIRKGRMY